jgi:phosphoglycolate phosphatase
VITLRFVEKPVPRTLLLDLDGTLVDSAPDLAASLNRVMAGRGHPPFALAEVAGMVGDGVGVLLARAFAARGSTPDDRAIADYEADYGANAAVATQPYPGAVATLTRLCGDGWRIGVCTNKPEALARSVLTQTGLARFIAAVGGGDSYPVRKPDPGHLRATLAAAGGKPERAVMVGDHHNDIAGARGAGIPCVFAAWGYGPPDMATGADAVAQGFTDLPAILDRLCP